MFGSGLPEAQLYSANVAGQELHRPDGAGRVGGAAGGVSAVVGFDLADRRQQLPGHAELGGRFLVEREVGGWDVGERGGAGLVADAAAHGGGDHEHRQQQAGGERRGCGLHAAASSAGSLVTSGCSAGLASTWRGKRSSPTTKRPCPRGQLSR